MSIPLYKMDEVILQNSALLKVQQTTAAAAALFVDQLHPTNFAAIPFILFNWASRMIKIVMIIMMVNNHRL